MEIFLFVGLAVLWLVIQYWLVPTIEKAREDAKKKKS